MSAIRELLTPRQLLLVGLILACALSRLIPHPPNFSPVESVALFAGACFASRVLAIAVPLAAMLLADLVLGFHWGMPVVYACIALIALAGGALGRKLSVPRIALFGVGAASFFFLVTNFAVWAGGTEGTYPYTLDGLIACYVAAIPFFHNQLAGVAVYGSVLFGAWAALRGRQPTPAPR